MRDVGIVLTESGKSPAWLRGAISSGWGLACTVNKESLLTMKVMGKKRSGLRISALTGGSAMNWYRNLYFGKTAEKKKDRIVEQIETGENRMFTYLIILAQTPVNQMEILTPATYRSQVKKNGEPLILGVACGWHEAQEVVRVIVEDVYIKTGDALVRQYFEGK